MYAGYGSCVYYEYSTYEHAHQIGLVHEPDLGVKATYGHLRMDTV
jgi:hypothetical protein